MKEKKKRTKEENRRDFTKQGSGSDSPMPHPGKTLSPHGVERPLLGVGAFGAKFYFRLWLSKFSRLTRRCLSLSAVLLALCVWLSLITVMSVAPIQQDGRIARRAAAASLKEDANFFIRSDERSNNKGSYPRRPWVRTGYLSTIDMQHEKGEKDSKRRDEESALAMNKERKSNKRDGKAITGVRPSSMVEKAVDNEFTGRSNINNIIKSTGVGRRRIHGFKTDETRELETASFSMSMKERRILPGVKNDKNKNSYIVTSLESLQTSYPLSPSPTFSSLPNQAPAPPLRAQRGGDRQHDVINIGPIPIMGIKSSRQAAGRNPGNQLPNSPSGEETAQDSVVFKVDSDVKDDIPKRGYTNQAPNKFFRDQSDLEKVTFQVASYHTKNGPLLGQLKSNLSPKDFDKKNSKTSYKFSGLGGKLTAQGLKMLKKSMNKKWPSGIRVEQHNRQGNFYDGRREALQINSHSVNVYDSSNIRTAQKIETSSADSLAHSYTRRQGMEMKTDSFPGLLNEESHRAFHDRTEIKHGQRATVLQFKISKNKKLGNSFNTPDPFQSTTYHQKEGDTKILRRERHVLVAVAGNVNSGEKNFGHSITRQRQRYNGAQGIRDGLNPRGLKQTVECTSLSSRHGSNLTLDTKKRQDDFSDSYQTRDQPEKTRDPIYSAEAFDKTDGMNGTSRNLSSRRVQSKTSIEKARSLSQSGEAYSTLDDGNKKGSCNTSGVIQNDGFDIYSYNVTASDAISLTRSIPDTRPRG